MRVIPTSGTVVSEHNALHIIDISDEDREHLVEILRYYTHRWRSFGESFGAMTAAEDLLEQFEEMANATGQQRHM